MAPHELESHGGDHEEEDDAMLDPAEAGEEIPDDEDAHMDSDDDDEEEPSSTIEEIQLQNDSIAHFDLHKDSVFCIAQHPIYPEIVATGGGDDVGYLFNTTPQEKPLLPASYQSDPQSIERESLVPLFKLDGHKDSLNAIVFTKPKGEYVVSAGLDGMLRAWKDATKAGSGQEWKFVAAVQEVEEINFLVACPNPSHANTVALGANDGSIWVYSINADDPNSPLTIVQAIYLHTASATAGAWTPDGKLLATVSEDGSLYVHDVFGDAAAAGLVNAQGSQTVVGLTALDERFKVEGGLYTVAISPNGAFAAVGGAEGNVRIVGLPRLGGADASATAGAKGSGSKSKAGGAKQSAGLKGGTSAAAGGQAGQILASLQAQSESIESISFAAPPMTIMATASVDGSIVLYDVAHRFAVRRHIRDAHEEEAVIKVEFVQDSKSGTQVLTSCGNDGVVRQWDPRGGTAAAAQGMVGEWRGHRGGAGGGDGGGGILGFVQSPDGRYVTTAGDDFVSLVFDTQA